MTRMLLVGGVEAERLRIARTIGRRGVLRVEMTSSIEVGLGLLEWRKYDIVGAFYDAALIDQFAAICHHQHVNPQLVLFGKVLRTNRAALSHSLRRTGLAPPIFFGEPTDEDPAPMETLLRYPRCIVLRTTQAVLVRPLTLAPD